MGIEQTLANVMRHLPPEQQQSVLDFAQSLAAKTERVGEDSSIHEILQNVRSEWLKEIDSMEAMEKGEGDVIA